MRGEKRREGEDEITQCTVIKIIIIIITITIIILQHRVELFVSALACLACPLPAKQHRDKTRQRVWPTASSAAATAGGFDLNCCGFPESSESPHLSVCLSSVFCLPSSASGFFCLLLRLHPEPHQPPISRHPDLRSPAHPPTSLSGPRNQNTAAAAATFQ